MSLGSVPHRTGGTAAPRHWRVRWLAVLGAGVVTLALTALPGRAVATAAVPDASPRDASCPWLDTSLTVDQRVSELVAAMTLDQKISLMQIEAGSGAFAGYQTFIPPIPGLCVPALVLEDDSAGVANGTAGVTQLPAPIAAASTFDTGVLHDYGAVIGGEMSGKGINDALAPTVNLVRVPQWGRAFESLGEDPYLTTKLGDADIEGIQSQGVIADVKHYAEYNQEANRTPSLGLDNVVASERTLQETELAIFGSAVQDAHADAVMCAFPAVNGTLACEDPYLLQTVLRGQFGFKGDIRADNPAPVSDEVKAANAGLDQTRTPFFGASSLTAEVQDGQISEATIDDAASAILYSMFSAGLFDHGPTGTIDANVSTPEHVAFARDTAEQSAVLLRDVHGALPLGSGHLHSVAVIGADADRYAETSGGGSGYVVSGNVVTPLQAITDRAGPGVNVTYSMGSGPYDALPDIPASALSTADGSGPGVTDQIYPNANLTGTPAVTSTATTIDREGTSSPLPGSAPSNNWSERWTGTLSPPVTGTYQFSLTCDRPCQLTVGGQLAIDNSKAAAFMAHHTATGTADLTAGQPATIAVTYRHTAPAGTTSPLQLGSVAQLGWLPPGTTPQSVTDAASAAAKAQVAIVFAGTFQGEAFDQPSLNLSGVDDQLIEAVAQANPHTIVVLNTGGPVLMPWLSDVSAVLEGWYPGQEDGTAIASLLFGDTDPGGKLPVTFPADPSQPLSADPARYPGVDGQVQYSEGLDIGYRWYDANNLTPLFPFGYGLSYTRFLFSQLQVTPFVPARDIDPNGGPSKVVAVARARVTNIGPRDGTEVAQLYLGDPSSTGEPVRQLRGFSRVELAPGHSARVTLPLTARDLAFWDSGAHDWTVSPGKYRVYVGDSAALPSLPLRGSFVVSGGGGQ
jgi:beta-glucosidase